MLVWKTWRSTNNLAYNQKYSVYGLYTTEEKEDAAEDEFGDKYFLKDVDFNKIVAYTNEITKTKQDTNIIFLNSKLETNQRTSKQIFRAKSKDIWIN